MKLGSDIIGMMERIEVRPAATDFEIVCHQCMIDRGKARCKTSGCPSGQKGKTRQAFFNCITSTLKSYTLNHQVKPNDLLAKAYIELGSAATLAGADPSFCLREGWRLLEVARKGPGAINDGTYTCMMDACSKSASMGNR